MHNSHLLLNMAQKGRGGEDGKATESGETGILQKSEKKKRRHVLECEHSMGGRKNENLLASSLHSVAVKSR